MRGLSGSRIGVVFLVVAVLLSGGASAQAGERVRLGFGHLTSNDVLVDGRDRWRSASHVASLVWGPEWRGRLPERLGDVIELRMGLEIITPEYLNSPPGRIDRPFAGALALGVHSHFRRGSTDVAAGVDLVMTGPQTQLDDVQTSIHDALGINGPSAAVRAGQIGNGLHPRLVVEAGRSFQLAPAAELRAFVEARWGVETLLRAGADLNLGRIGGAGELLARDHVSGHRYRVTGGSTGGVSVVLGGDIARVEKSLFLPEPGFRPERERTRLRAGFHWQGARGGASGFYGLTWLSEEVVGQSEPQLLGSAMLKFRF